jgi:hypothetical protein
MDTDGSLCWRKDDGVIVKIASAGTYTLTIPATGTAALLGTAQTFSAAQTFGSVLTAPGIKPASDSTTAVQLQSAAGTAILTVDTTNGAVLVPQLQIDSSNYYLDAYSHGGLRLRSLNVAIENDAAWSMSAGMNGFLFVLTTTDSHGALFYLRSSANIATEVLDPYSVFSITKDTANSMNVYAEGTTYTIQNKRGGTKNVMIFFLG